MHAPHYSDTCRCRNCGAVRNASRFQPGQVVKRHIHGTPIHDWTVISWVGRESAYLCECVSPWREEAVRRYFSANEIRHA